ncbi:hypothetical protein JCM21900_001845 [Sporobolomyces salmonicolor]
MAAVALVTVQTARRPAQRIAASLFSLSPIFGASSARAAPSLYTSSHASPVPSTSSLTVSFTFSAAPALPTYALPSLATLIPDSLSAGLRDLLPPWVFAVPKSKTTHSAKRMRSANKGLKEKHNLVACPSCGAPKLSHHLCHECHVAFRREVHREAKEPRAAESGEV